MKTRLLQFAIFAQVSACFTTIYLVQPVLPILQAEFGVSLTQASQSVSMVILGVALSTLVFGRLADSLPIKPLIALGCVFVAGSGLACAGVHAIPLFLALRFLQGLFIPALTTCLAAYLARTLPVERLNTVMGAYVAATVAGGLGGRLLGGWIHPPLHWRYAFVTSALLVFMTTAAALMILPPEKRQRGSTSSGPGYRELVTSSRLIPLFLVGFGSLFIYGATFNYLPYYLAAPPFSASTNTITTVYFTYLIGVVVAPASGRISNRCGNGFTMLLGLGLMGLGLGISRAPWMAAVVLGLSLLCAGFFAVHTAAVGAMNRSLTESRGRANSLYILWYYLGGSCGITVMGWAWQHAAWNGVLVVGFAMLFILAAIALWEKRLERTGRL
ncbi:MAG: MFS transporter [Desulfomicrobiaceae bacterium]